MKSQHERIVDLEEHITQLQRDFDILVTFINVGATKDECDCGGQCGCGPTYKQIKETK